MLIIKLKDSIEHLGDELVDRTKWETRENNRYSDFRLLHKVQVLEYLVRKLF